MHRSLDDSIRSRLEALNRAPLPATVPRPSGEASSEHKRLVPAPKRAALPAAALPQCIPGLLRSGKPIENSGGQHLRICIPLEKLWNNGAQLIASRQVYLQSQLAIAKQAIEPTIA